MKIGDLVMIPFPTDDERSWWWQGTIGIIIKEAIPFRGYTSKGGGSFPCWHVMVGARLVNLKEETLEVISEAR